MACILERGIKIPGVLKSDYTDLIYYSNSKTTWKRDKWETKLRKDGYRYSFFFLYTCMENELALLVDIIPGIRVESSYSSCEE